MIKVKDYMKFVAEIKSSTVTKFYLTN